MTDPLEHLDAQALENARAHASKLAHDVGKYIARIARNLPDGEIPEALSKLMETDLYAIDGRHRAAELFEQLSAPLDALLQDPRLLECRDLLASIDALETAVLERDPAAIRQSAECAIRIASHLSGIHRDIAVALEVARKR